MAHIQCCATHTPSQPVPQPPTERVHKHLASTSHLASTPHLASTSRSTKGRTQRHREKMERAKSVMQVQEPGIITPIVMTTCAIPRRVRVSVSVLHRQVSVLHRQYLPSPCAYQLPSCLATCATQQLPSLGVYRECLAGWCRQSW